MDTMCRDLDTLWEPTQFITVTLSPVLLSTASQDHCHILVNTPHYTTRSQPRRKWQARDSASRNLSIHALHNYNSMSNRRAIAPIQAHPMLPKVMKMQKAATIILTSLSSMLNQWSTVLSPHWTITSTLSNTANLNQDDTVTV